jgi:hypothetical protein
MGDASKRSEQIRYCIEREPHHIVVGERCSQPYTPCFRVRSAQSHSDYLRNKQNICPATVGRRGLNLQPCTLEGGNTVNPAQTLSLNNPVTLSLPSGSEYTAAKRRAIELTVSPSTRYANVIRGIAPEQQTPIPVDLPLSALREPGVAVAPLRDWRSETNGVPFRVGVRQPGR